MVPQQLVSSRLAALIGQVERGEEVDVQRALALQALDIARMGEQFAVEILTRDEAEDDKLERAIDGN